LHQNEEEDRGYQMYFENFLNFTLLDNELQEALDFGCGKTSLLAQMSDRRR